jgi:hypothetical protein
MHRFHIGKDAIRVGAGLRAAARSSKHAAEGMSYGRQE